MLTLVRHSFQVCLYVCMLLCVCCESRVFLSLHGFVGNPSVDRCVGQAVAHGPAEGVEFQPRHDCARGVGQPLAFAVWLLVRPQDLVLWHVLDCQQLPADINIAALPVAVSVEFGDYLPAQDRGTQIVSCCRFFACAGGFL